MRKKFIVMMKVSLIVGFLFALTNISGHLVSEKESIFKIGEKTTIVYLNCNKGFDYLTTTNYFDEQNILSLSLKTKGKTDTINIAKAKLEYENIVSENVLNWNDYEKRYFNERFAKILPYIIKYTPKIIPDTVYLIKSNKYVEFSMPFTKGKAIIIPESEIPSFVMGKLVKKSIEHTIIHELFHIYSFNHISERDDLYSLIGYQKIDKIDIPDELKELQIVNPDDNILNYFRISLNNPQVNEKQDFITLIMSKYSKYEGYKGLLSRFSILLGYIHTKMIRVQETNGKWEVVYKENKAELYSKDALPEYWDKIVLNHGLTMTPEETLAEDFALLIDNRMGRSREDEFSNKDLEFLNRFEAMLK